jgi:hypothetical protein
MPSKPILDLLDCFHNRLDLAESSLAELRRICQEELDSLSEDDLLTLQVLPDGEIWNEEIDEFLDLAAQDIREIARQELIHRDHLLQQVAVTNPPVREVVQAILTPTKAVQDPSTPSLGMRTRLWWLSQQQLARCGIEELVGLAQLPGGEVESAAVIRLARREIIQRGYWPPHRADDVGEEFYYWGYPRGDSIPFRITDRKIVVNNQLIAPTAVADYRITRTWGISLPAAVCCLLILSLVPFLLPGFVIIGILDATRWRGKDAVVPWVLLFSCLGSLIGLWRLGVSGWLLLAVPVVWIVALAVIGSSELPPDQPLMKRRHRLAVTTRDGQTYVTTLNNEPIDLLRTAFDTLLREVNLPPAPINETVHP